MINILFCDDNTEFLSILFGYVRDIIQNDSERILRMRNFTAMITAAKSFLLPKEIVLMLSFLT